jgi:hypothetical protein
MTTAVEHVFSRRLRDAGLGRFPAADGRAEVGPALTGPCDAVTLFSQHVVVAAAVPPDWVDEQMARQLDRPETDQATGYGLLLGGLAERLGNPPMAVSMLLAATYQPAVLHGDAEPGGEAAPNWAAYRTDVRCYRYRGPGVSGVLALGRGPGGRWDVYLHADEQPGRGAQASRELLTAARTMVPDHDLLFASAPLQDPRVLRAVLGSGFLPICTEALFLTRPAH